MHIYNNIYIYLNLRGTKLATFLKSSTLRYKNHVSFALHVYMRERERERSDINKRILFIIHTSEQFL